jgi:hypothetical protein
MPNPGADAQLRKVTLNLYEEDCAAMERIFGRGWTTAIRELLHHNVMRSDAFQLIHRRTLGDIE